MEIIELRKDEREKRLKLGRLVFCTSVCPGAKFGSQALAVRKTHYKEVSVIEERSGQEIRNNEDGSKFYIR